MRAQIKLCPGYCNPNSVADVAQLGHRPPSHLRRRGQVPARPNFRDGPGRFSVSARDKKLRLSGASVADRGTPDPSVAGRRPGYDTATS
jgi:hypothetical protein